MKTVAVAIVAAMLVGIRFENLVADDDQSDAVTGTVVSPDGKPLPGIRIQAYPRPISRNQAAARTPFDQVTDANGQFCVVFPKDAESALWFIPKDFAPIEKNLAKKRGDLGILKLTEGVRVSGHVTSAEGKPIKGVTVQIVHTGTRQSRFPTDLYLRRDAISDADGKFEFDPLAPGNYTVAPIETFTDEKGSRRWYEIPGVFVQKRVAIKDEAGTLSVSLQAMPHVVFSGQGHDSRGQKTAAYTIRISGFVDGVQWSATGHPDLHGAFSIRVPHGLQRAWAQAILKQNEVVRYRLGKEGPLQNRTLEPMDLGTMNDDVIDFEMFLYNSPVVVISAVDEEHQPVPGFQVVATYPWGNQSFVLKDGLRSDLEFKLGAQGRYHTRQLLPDEEVTFKLTAPDFEPAEKKMKLAEGETQHLVITMKKRPSGNSNSDP